MLLDFHKLVTKYRLKIKGVVHAGAHHGEEVKDYKRYTRNIVLIEPCADAFNKLVTSLSPKNDFNPKLYNVALGASETTMQMNIETSNKGQSNSLLKPVEHLTQYPEIIFAETETVKVNKLDNLAFNRNDFNLLVMDIQGYELEALKGATWTLDHIDYIYTEVNKTEVYEGCAKVSELDEFLKRWNFVRVETSQWVNDSWGDALYIKKKPSEILNVARHELIHGRSSNFKQEPKIIYPEDNKPYFEQWYSANRSPVEGWTYLDVFWTSYYVNGNRNGRINTNDLQRYLNTLDKSKKYYTVVQYDDGILNDVRHLNLRVYAMSGKRIDYPLPLICQPHPFKFDFERNILANFIGKETHPIRKEILKLKGQPHLYISSNQHSLESFCHVLSTSVFTLCPRGYGQTSFRICEALQYGSIPVYISDEFIHPHNVDFDSYGIAIAPNELSTTLEAIQQMHWGQIEYLQEKGKHYYQSLFTFEANKKLIEEDLKKQV